MPKQRFILKIHKSLTLSALLLVSCGGTQAPLPGDVPVSVPATAPVTTATDEVKEGVLLEQAGVLPERAEVSAFYVEIIEENSDSLGASANASLKSFKTPFMMRDGKIYIERDVIESAKKGIKDENYLLTIEPSLMDLREASLYVRYITSYLGNSRRVSYQEFYIFKSLPAELNLKSKSFDVSKDKFSLSFFDSFSNLENIRLLPDKITFAANNGTVTANNQELVQDNKTSISKSSKKIRITIEILSDKTEGSISDRIAKQDLGLNEFSTNLFIINKGSIGEIFF